MRFFIAGRSSGLRDDDVLGTPRNIGSLASSEHPGLFRKLLALGLFTAGSLCAFSTFSEELVSANRPDDAGEAIIFGSAAEWATDDLSRPPSTWGRQGVLAGPGAGRLTLARSGPLSPQRGDVGAEDGGSLMTNPDEISRQSNNPLGGDFILWLNFLDFDRQQGEITDTTRDSYSHLLQPVIPIALPQIGEHWILVNRPTVLTFIDREVPRGPNPLKPGFSRFDNKGGFGDIEYLALLGTSTPTNTGWMADSFGVGDAVLAAGITTRFPTGRDSLSENVYAAGPALTAAFVGKKWTFATLMQHWWDYKEQDDANSYNFTRMQVFYFRSLPGGWQIGGSPKITADWDEDSDDRWTVPFGLGVFRTVIFGDVPVKMGLEFKPSIVRPDSLGTNYQIELTVIPVTPNFVASWFK